MSKWVFVHDRLVKEEAACLHFRDLALQRGYGVFDFFKVNNFQPVFLDDHLDRFYHSAEMMHLQVGKTREELKDIITRLITKNHTAHTGIRITLTGGYSEDGYRITRPNLIISQQHFSPPTRELYEKGIKLATYPFQRQFPQVKTIDYLMALWLQPFIKAQAVDDVLYFNPDSITECPRANLFVVTQENKILTPSDAILKGIIRNKLLDLAGEHFDTEERNISAEEALRAKEMFITSTTKNVLPVTFLNGKRIGEGSPGAITTQLQELVIQAQPQDAPVG